MIKNNPTNKTAIPIKVHRTQGASVKALSGDLLSVPFKLTIKVSFVIPPSMNHAVPARFFLNPVNG
jgi:hypothetical protein